jgi:hypothetical protein
MAIRATMAEVRSSQPLSSTLVKHFHRLRLSYEESRPEFVALHRCAEDEGAAIMPVM